MLITVAKSLLLCKRTYSEVMGLECGYVWVAIILPITLIGSELRWKEEWRKYSCHCSSVHMCVCNACMCMCVCASTYAYLQVVIRK